ncbi:MAG: T9SS type A sorting domain-containing protein [Flavobacteriales bacterium]|jgi:hypothetical protein|tara:strand:- start:4647 stop:6563 length:1917 start_codon:yes stop_codon:yes gene_type:complete
MKKTFTTLVSLLFSTIIIAQISPYKLKNGNNQAKINDKVIMSGSESLSHLMVNPNPNTIALKTVSSNEEMLGSTTYDLQSNACVDNRLIRHADGTISAAWTMSAQFSTSYSDRGTGYNFYDGSTWDSYPNARLESSRGGWPSILATGSGKEIAITHNTDNGYLLMTHRTSIGSGSWNEDIVSSIDSNGLYRDIIWNRAVIGGANQQTIHMVGVIANTALGGTIYNGLDGALVYYRSQDGGSTWDIKDLQLPTLDSTKYLGFSGDSYAIASNGETVVVAYFGGLDDSAIIKSTDNGNTWNATSFLDFPVDKYAPDAGIDLDNDGLMDSLYSTDGTGALLLDDNNMAHVFYGNMLLLDADLTDGNTSYFASTNGLMYWNENMGADDYASNPISSPSLWFSNLGQMIASAQDTDGDNLLNYVDYPTYYMSLTCMPNAGIDANGNIFVSYSELMENIDNGSQNFRHVNVIKSMDGGVNWSAPTDVTPHNAWSGAQECVFATIDRNVDDKIRLIYQKDFEPGLAVRGDEDIIDVNEIIYLEIDTTELSNTSTNISEISSLNTISIYPNPTASFTNVNLYSSVNKNIILRLTNIIGKIVSEVNIHVVSGNNNINLDVSNLKNGIYFINSESINESKSIKLIISK